jgi:MFS family permease
MIYLPVWCDQFGPRNRKTIMISLIQLGVPLGVVAGYYLTAWLKGIKGWQFSFVVQGIAIASMSIVVLLIPSVYFSKSLTFKAKNKFNKEVFSESQHDMNESKQTMRALETGVNMSFGKKKTSRCSNISSILSQRVFLLCTLCLSSLFFIITVVQFWAPDYLKDVLLVDDEKKINWSFIIVCVSSPTLGVAFGGLTSSKIGGYESKHSILLCLIFAICASLCAIPVTLVDSIVYFTLWLWLVLFFGGAIVPAMTGIIISSLPVEHRGSANSITSALTTLFGYLPAPFVYSEIYELTKAINPKIAFMCVMYYSFAGVILLSVAAYFRYKTFEETNKMSVLLPPDRRVTSPKKESMLTSSMAHVFGAANADNAEDLIQEEDNAYSSDSSAGVSDDGLRGGKLHITDESPGYKKKIYYSESDSNLSCNRPTSTPHFNAIGQHDFDHLRDKNSSILILGSKKEESVFSPINGGASKPSDTSFERIISNNSLKEDNSYVLKNENKDEVIKSL